MNAVTEGIIETIGAAGFTVQLYGEDGQNVVEAVNEAEASQCWSWSMLTAGAAAATAFIALLAYGSPNQAEPPVVGEIRGMRTRGMTLKAIAEILTERGIPTKTGKSSGWTHQAVARTLARERTRR